MKSKMTTVSSDQHSLTVRIAIINDNEVVDDMEMRFPFNVIPPQIAHQIASQLAMCNSYLVEYGKDGNPVPVPNAK